MLSVPAFGAPPDAELPPPPPPPPPQPAAARATVSTSSAATSGRMNLDRAIMGGLPWSNDCATISRAVDGFKGPPAFLRRGRSPRSPGQGRGTSAGRSAPPPPPGRGAG